MRLTEKNELGYVLHIKPANNSIANEFAIVGYTASKLGQLEDIEEELGIDLITLYKALKNGIYFYGQKEEEPQDVQLRMFHEEPMLVHTCEDLTDLEVYVAGYGLSWDLVKMSVDEEKELEYDK